MRLLSSGKKQAHHMVRYANLATICCGAHLTPNLTGFNQKRSHITRVCIYKGKLVIYCPKGSQALTPKGRNYQMQ